MKSERSSFFWAVPTVLGVLIGVGIGLSVDHWPNEGACGVFSSSIASSWVQALGTLVAIVIALYVPNAIHRRDSKDKEAERQMRARLVATRLILPAAEIYSQAKAISTGLGESLNSEPERGRPPRPSDMPAVERVAELWSEISLLPKPAAECFAMLIAAGRGYNAMIASFNEARRIPESIERAKREGPIWLASAENIQVLAKSANEFARSVSGLNLPSPAPEERS